MSDDNDGSRSVVQIDRNNLDKECVRLPSDYVKYAHIAADAKRDVDELKCHLDVIEADLRKQIRDTPGKFGIEKLTESSLSETVLLQSEYRKKLKELNRARHESEMAQAVVWGLEHKKRTLTLLVELHGMGYFSAPKVSERGREAVQEMTRKKVHRLRDDND